jgi:hypothetical protein
MGNPSGLPFAGDCLPAGHRKSDWQLQNCKFEEVLAAPSPKLQFPVPPRPAGPYRSPCTSRIIHTAINPGGSRIGVACPRT